AKAGLIYAPVNLGLKPDEIAYCLNDAGVRVLLIEDTLAQAAAPLAEQLPTLERIYWHGPQAQQHIHTTKSAGTFDALVASGHDAPLEVLIDDRDPVQLLYTSGTTALPKGVLTNHLSVTMAALSNSAVNGTDADDTVLVNL